MSNRQVQWGLLSTARINERLIPAMRESKRSNLLAVASRSQLKADEYAHQHGIPRAYGNYEAMLADPAVDAVYVSLPNGYHEEWCIKCADAGKHILCEKPLALTVAEVDHMAEAARRNGVILQEAAMYRYHPQTHKVQELIDQRAIGDVRMIQSLFCFTLANPGDIRLDAAIGGGALWDIGSYPVSFARTVMRAEPVEVSAWQVWSDGGVDLTLMGQLHFPNGTLAQFGCSFQAVPYWDMDFIGSAGRIRLDIPWNQQLNTASHLYVSRVSGAGSATFGDSTDNLVDEVFTFDGRSAYHYEVDAMVSSILDGTPPALPLESSRGNIATLVALYTSAREGRVVRL